MHWSAYQHELKAVTHKKSHQVFYSCSNKLKSGNIKLQVTFKSKGECAQILYLNKNKTLI